MTTIPNIPLTEVESAPELMDTQLKISINTPQRLNTRPAIPLHLMRSFIKMAEIINAIIGLKVLIMDASMAVVSVIANKKESWVINSPRNDASAIFQKSFFSIFSFGAQKSEHSQNRAVAPNDLRQNKAMGVMFPSMAIFLQLIILKPNMAYAVKHAIFPKRTLLFFIF